VRRSGCSSATIFSAAGGTHEDFDEYDRVMAAERRLAVLVRPTRLTGQHVTALTGITGEVRRESRGRGAAGRHRTARVPRSQVWEYGRRAGEPPQRSTRMVAVETLSATEVLEAMVAMFASGDPSKAATVIGDDYLDHQGLGTGPIRGVDGFAYVVRTNHAAYETQDICIEDLFGVGSCSRQDQVAGTSS
jgi:hypothetical protein